jgi:hypothetical protein
MPFSPQELELMDHYALRVVQGEFRNAVKATRQFLAERAELAQRFPDDRILARPRSYHSAHSRMCERSRELGRPAIYIPIATEERELIERHAQKLALGIYHTPREATQACMRASAELRERGAMPERAFRSVYQQISERVRAMGGTWVGSWFSAEESRLLDQFAKSLAQGEFTSVKQAGRACWKETERLHRLRESGKPPALRLPLTRTQRSITGELRMRSIELGRARNREFWKPAELQIAVEWAKRWLAGKGTPERISMGDTVRMLSDDLARRGFNRSPERCESQLTHLVYRRRELLTGGIPETQ